MTIESTYGCNELHGIAKGVEMNCAPQKITSTERRPSDLNMIRIRRYLHGVHGVLLLRSFHFHLHFFPWQIMLDSGSFWPQKGWHGVSWICPSLILVPFYPFGMLASP
jgi:hypothetical protein